MTVNLGTLEDDANIEGELALSWIKLNRDAASLSILLPGIHFLIRWRNRNGRYWNVFYTNGKLSAGSASAE